MQTKEEIVSEIISLVTQLADSQEAEQADQTVEMLTIRECTEVIRGLSEHTIRILISQGKLPCVRTGQGLRGKILINKADLIAYFNRQTAQKRTVQKGE